LDLKENVAISTRGGLLGHVNDIADTFISWWAVLYTGSPGGAHHGGATHSSDTAVDGEVLRFVWGLYINLSATVSAILPSPL